MECGKTLGDLERYFDEEDSLVKVREVEHIRKVLSFDAIEEVITELNWINVQGGQPYMKDWVEEQKRLYELLVLAGY